MKNLLFFLLTAISFMLISCGSSENSIIDEPRDQRIEQTIPGDVNQNGKLSIEDVTDLIDLLMNGCTEQRCDVNGDGKVSIDDVTTLIDMLLMGDVIIEDGVYTVNGVSFKMIDVEGGTFIMGAPNTEPASFTFEKPQHEVTVSPFKIGETEVTQELWTAIMGTNPSINKMDPQNPVEYVSWDDCQAFITKLNQKTHLHFRLPTEAEWEYAAIGGKYTHYYKFSGSGTANKVAWYIVNSNGSSHPVKQLQCNELEIYDMSGNVYEWVNDWYDRYTADPQVDPKGSKTGSYKVYRGGAWHIGAGESRCHFRYMREPSYRTPSHGLRLAL